jgi:hypothetical protein
VTAGTTDRPNSDGTWPLAVVNGQRSLECLGCGHCCKSGPCGLVWTVYPPEVTQKWSPVAWTCPELRQDGDRYRCGLILDAEGEEKTRRLTNLYIGAGCCAGLNSDRQRLARGR